MKIIAVFPHFGPKIDPILYSKSPEVPSTVSAISPLEKGYFAMRFAALKPQRKVLSDRWKIKILPENSMVLTTCFFYISIVFFELRLGYAYFEIHFSKFLPTLNP